MPRQQLWKPFIIVASYVFYAAADPRFCFLLAAITLVSQLAVGAGLSLIALGLIKKVMLADYLARTVVDPVFAVPQAYSAPDAILAAYGYAAQIFCDFSGYTDMAIGLALLTGFVFPQNFNS